MEQENASQSAGHVGVTVLRKDRWIPDEVRRWSPRSALGHYVQTLLHFLPTEAAEELLARVSRTLVCETALFGVVLRAGGRREELGLLGVRKVTDNGAQFICDAWRGTKTIGNMKYHGLGTGTNAEAQADTALQTELTTQYNPDNTRATGTLAGSANVFTSVATNTVDATAAVTEHGLFDQAATGGGVLFDRTVFSVVNLASADSLQTTYSWTLSAGG
jgi:hypothetical protein